MHLKQFKGRDPKICSSFRSQGASLHYFVLGPQKALGGPGCISRSEKLKSKELIVPDDDIIQEIKRNAIPRQNEVIICLDT